jgi:RNA polymerase sigma-B factor
MTAQALSAPSTSTAQDRKSEFRAAQRAQKNRTTLDRYAAAVTALPEEQRRIIDAIAVDHLCVAETIARRYAGNSQDWNDIRQVAYVGLIKAARRFDPERGDDFVSFAVPTISGEIKRYLRDHGWFIRPPRHVQELRSTIAHAVPRLMQEFGHAPSRSEIAASLGEGLSAIDSALDSPESMRPKSLDARSNEENEISLAERLGCIDERLERAEVIAEVGAACRMLPARDRRILYLRFFQECTQQEIAAELGVTQVQVSRLLAKILGRLRLELGAAT